MDEDTIRNMLQNARERPAYVVQILEFKLGREPTQEEIDAVVKDNELSRIARQKWVEIQPWHIKKYLIEKEKRIRTVLIKRYNVPESLINLYTNEIEEKYRDW